VCYNKSMDKTIEKPTSPLTGTETPLATTKLSSKVEKLKFWENPTFLFVLMGVLTMIVMISTYFIAQRYDDPMIVIASVSTVAGITTLIGGITIKTIDQLSQANRMKTEFVSIASHQLRTPLSIIKWYVEFLLKPEKQKNLTSEQLGYVQTINQANLRMIRLVNDLLDISRVESGKIQIRPEATNVVELTKNIIAENHTLADQKKIKLQLKYSNSIPLLLVDPKRIAMVIENLLSNSIKYTRHDRHGVASIELSKDGKKLLFSIADNGVGIPASDHKNIFKKFFRANNAMRLKTSGTGLGLFIAKAIIESHRGKIWFVSRENEGSTFYFNLPLKQKKLVI